MFPIHLMKAIIILSFCNTIFTKDLLDSLTSEEKQQFFDNVARRIANETKPIKEEITLSNNILDKHEEYVDKVMKEEHESIIKSKNLKEGKVGENEKNEDTKDDFRKQLEAFFDNHRVHVDADKSVLPLLQDMPNEKLITDTPTHNSAEVSDVNPNHKFATDYFQYGARVDDFERKVTTDDLFRDYADDYDSNDDEPFDVHNAASRVHNAASRVKIIRLDNLKSKSIAEPRNTKKVLAFVINKPEDLDNLLSQNDVADTEFNPKIKLFYNALLKKRDDPDEGNFLLQREDNIKLSDIRGYNTKPDSENQANLVSKLAFHRILNKVGKNTQEEPLKRLKDPVYVLIKS